VNRFISSEIKFWAGTGRWPKPWRKMMMRMMMMMMM